MFVKKDLRKVPEILRDAVAGCGDAGGGECDDDNNDKNKSNGTILKNLHLSKRKAEFNGTVDVFKRQQESSRDIADVLRTVESLSLYDCDITSLEGLSACLPNLQDLCLGRNPNLQVVDDENFGRLVHLKKLWFDDCQLSNVDCLMSLHNMEELRLSQNKLSSLPSSIGHDMPKLRVLSVDGNNIKNLPTSLSTLQQLQILQIRSNGIESTFTTLLNDVLPSTNSLRIVHASSNQLRGSINLSAVRSKCPKLELLYLNSNRLTKVVLSDDGNDNNNNYDIGPLRRINLSNNDIDNIPTEWKNIISKTKSSSSSSSFDAATGTLKLVHDNNNNDENMLGEANNDDAAVTMTTTLTVLLDNNPILEDDDLNENKTDVSSKMIAAAATTDDNQGDAMMMDVDEEDQA